MCGFLPESSQARARADQMRVAEAMMRQRIMNELASAPVPPHVPLTLGPVDASQPATAAAAAPGPSLSPSVEPPRKRAKYDWRQHLPKNKANHPYDRDQPARVLGGRAGASAVLEDDYRLDVPGPSRHQLYERSPNLSLNAPPTSTPYGLEHGDLSAEPSPDRWAAKRADALRKRDAARLGSSPTQPTNRRASGASDKAADAIAVVDVPLAPPLTDQQQSILQKVLDGESVFFTGSAGTGKSVLLRAIIAEFDKRARAERQARREGKEWEKDWSLGKTASTGLAALNIDGQTLHSWAGIGLGNKTVNEYVSEILRFGSLWKRWKHTQALLIDEISMINSELFDLLDQIGRRLRISDRPFGGIQLILSGDFFQLPPVFKDGDPERLYAFQADAWDELFGGTNAKHMFALQTVFRQSDPTFVRILEAMRKGDLSAADDKVLQKLDRVVKYDDGIDAAELYATNAEVDNENMRRLGMLPGSQYEYASFDTAGRMESGKQVPLDRAIKMLDDQTRWPQDISLRVGATVMCVVNKPEMGLANGSCGKVVDMMTRAQTVRRGIPSLGESLGHEDDMYPVVEFAKPRHSTVAPPDRIWIPRLMVDIKNPNNTVRASRCQIPLLLAWALTMHKAQGQTLERVKVNAERVFAKGQIYVALSRATDMETLEIRAFSKKLVSADPRVLVWTKRNGL